ncbi:membrane hypothetical protein [Vibrio chagasii]|nr:membrane hypothetical protein [Vibrio chagasii]CAH6907444.1 membrane hypothetical protein [Vibrio chagasii]CAH7178530.1 membrane hypothetical protein [Vibrio chagasii]
MFSKSILVLVLKIIAAICSFLLNIVLVRQLGSEDSGHFFYYQTQVLFFSVLATLGLQSLIIKESALLGVGGRKALPMIKGIPVVALLVSSIITLAIYLYGVHFTNDLYPSSQAIKLGVGVFFISLNVIFCSLNQGIGNYYFSVFFQTLFFNLSLLLIMLGIGKELSTEAVINLYILSLVVGVILQAIYLLNSKLISARDVFLSKIDFKLLFLSCLPFLVMVGSERAMLLVIQFFLEKHASSQAISYFVVIVRIVAVPVLILSSVNVMLSRKISISYNCSDISDLELTAKKASRIVIPISIMFFLIILILSEYILSIFGDEFKGIKIPLIIAALGQCINLATGTVSIFLLMTGNEKKLRNSLFSSLVIMIIYVCFSYDEFTLINAVVAFSIYQIMSNSISWLYVKKELGINTIKVF